jgi:hypothetical protein
MTTPTPMPDANAATAAYEQTAERVRALTEQFIEGAKRAGNYSLDIYVKSLENLVEFEQRAAGASQLDWVNSITQAHAKFMQDVSAAYVSAARDMLK